MTDRPTDSYDLVFALEGDRHPQNVTVKLDATAQEVLIAIVEKTGRTEIVEIFIEDEDECLPSDHPLVEVIIKEFKLVHAATKGEVKVSVSYNGRNVERDFKPSATMQKVIDWAISDKGLNLEGTGADYQLKLGEEVLPPDAHVGQVSGGKKHVRLTLVFRVKPQG